MGRDDVGDQKGGGERCRGDVCYYPIGKHKGEPRNEWLMTHRELAKRLSAYGFFMHIYFSAS